MILGILAAIVVPKFSGRTEQARITAAQSQIATFGTATFTQTGGTNSVGTDLFLGYEDSSDGSYDLSASGILTVGGEEQIGVSGMGDFSQSGGTHDVTGSLRLGTNGTGDGSYDMSDGDLTVGGTLFVGVDGNGDDRFRTPAPRSPSASRRS